MSRNSAAVLDVRSSEVTVVVGARGVNNTFVLQGGHTQPYKGYEQAEFFDVKDLQDAVFAALEEASQSAGVRIRELYIGVPGEFIRIQTQRCLMNFENKRKVTAADVKALRESGLKADGSPYTVIHKAAAYYATSDRRRTSDPVGMFSESLEGLYCYFLADDHFIDVFDSILSEYGIKKRVYLPSSLAQALYLIPQGMRETGAVLLDVDNISMTFSAVEGDGITWQQAYSEGGGHVVAQIYLESQVEIPYYVLEAMVGKINLASLDDANVSVEYADRQAVYTLPLYFLKGCVQDGLDILCDVVEACFEMSGDPGLNYRPILLTGGGITNIRGVREYLTQRLGRNVEIIAPGLPYYNQAAQSSLFGLLDMALEQKRKTSFFYKLFHGIGG